LGNRKTPVKLTFTPTFTEH